MERAVKPDPDTKATAAERLTQSGKWYGREGLEGVDVSTLRLDVVLVTVWRQRPEAFLSDAAMTPHSAASHAVNVVEPFQMKRFGKLKLGRNKDDPVDALLIAEYCRLLFPRIWSPPSRQIKRLRGLLRLRDGLKVAIVQGPTGPRPVGSTIPRFRSWRASSPACEASRPAQTQQ